MFDEIYRSLWKRVYDFSEGDDRLLFIGGCLAVGYTTYFLSQIPYLILDMTGKPKFLAKYRIKERSKENLTWPQVKSIMKVSIPTYLCSLFIVIMSVYPLQKLRGVEMGMKLPSLPRIIVEYFAMVLIGDGLFFYTHVILHHPKLYKHVHKMHHDIRPVVAIASSYAHPVEQIFHDMLPTIMCPIILGSHVSIFWLWVFLSTMAAGKGHSGYNFPFLGSTEDHYYHHIKHTKLFGVFGVFVYIHGTLPYPDDPFYATQWGLLNNLKKHHKQQNKRF